MNNIPNKKTENFSLKQIDWSKVQQDMKEKLGNDIYESWLKKIDFIEEFNNYILISVSTRFIRDWITSRYLDQILQIVKNHKKEIDRIEFTINEKKAEIVNIDNKFNEFENKDNKNISFIKESFINEIFLLSSFSDLFNLLSIFTISAFFSLIVNSILSISLL